MMRIILIAAGTYGVLCLLVFLARHRLVFPLRGGTQGEPARFGIADGRRVTIPVGADTLDCWWLPATGRAGVLIWFHGNGETIAGLAPVLRDFRPPGLALLAVSYRGYSGSTGSPTVTRAEQDALAVYDWAAARPDVDPARIFVYGRSIGTGSAIHVASQRAVAGLIVESGFTSLPGLARVNYPFFPGFLSPAGFDNLLRIGQVKGPILLVHGDADRIIPVSMGRALAVAAGPRAELKIIEGADHNDTYDHGGARYVGWVLDFLARSPTHHRGDTLTP